MHVRTRTHPDGVGPALLHAARKRGVYVRAPSTEEAFVAAYTRAIRQQENHVCELCLTAAGPVAVLFHAGTLHVAHHLGEEHALASALKVQERILLLVWVVLPRFVVEYAPGRACVIRRNTRERLLRRWRRHAGMRPPEQSIL